MCAGVAGPKTYRGYNLHLAGMELYLAGTRLYLADTEGHVFGP